jgi:hypothetical protein
MDTDSEAEIIQTLHLTLVQVVVVLVELVQTEVMVELLLAALAEQVLSLALL